MFDEKTILARLQNGENVQKIADEMAAMINAANKAYADQKAAEEAAKAEAAKAEIQKKEELQDILDMFVDWFGTYYGVNAESVKAELTADQVIELVDSLKEYIEAMKGLEAMFGKPVAKPAVKVIKSNTKPTNADETINDFLKKMGW